MAVKELTGSARERLLAAADELFYSEGVQTVGIDRIIERAGVAKASLYNTFGSKEALVRAYLDGRRDSLVGRLEKAIASGATPREQILAIFASQAEVMRRPTFRGCAFQAASAEAVRGSQVEAATDEYRAWFRARLTSLCTELGAADPSALAVQLQLIYDGATASARMDRTDVAGTAAQAAVAALLDAAVVGTRR